MAAMAVAMVYAVAGNDMIFRHYSVYDGLWRTAIRALSQDKYGYIWIGSDAGLKRFDGVQMRDFVAPTDKSMQAVSALYDMGDSLMVGTYNGLYVLNYKTEQLRPFVLEQGKGQQMLQITSVTVDMDGNMWVSTMGRGVYECIMSKGLVRHFDVGSDNKVSYVFADSNNQIWVLSAGYGSAIMRYDKSAGRFMPFSLSGGWSPKAFCMKETSDGTLWLGTCENGLVAFDSSGNIKASYLGQGSKDYAFRIHSITEKRPGVLLLGCDNGLAVVDVRENKSWMYCNGDDMSNAISGSFVYPVLVDYEGGIWVGTFYSGLNYVSPSYGGFNVFRHKPEANSVKGNIINRFCEDSYHRIWIASDDGGLNRYDPQTGHFEHFVIGDGGISDNNIHALCIDGNDLWIGTYTGGLHVMDIRTGKIRTYKSGRNAHSIYSNSCYAIHRDRAGKIWIGTIEGINVYRKETDDFLRVKSLEATIIDIAEDNKGRMWFATQSTGVWCYNTKTKKWKAYKNGEAYSIVNSIFVEHDGNIWLATDDGLLKFDEKNNWFVLAEKSPDVGVCSVVEDNGTLWLTTNNGLYKYTEGKALQRFDVNDGLQSNQFIPNGAMKASDGCIYVGTVNGFNSFYPYQIKTNTLPPKIMITAVDVMNKTVSVGDKRLKESLATGKKIELSYQDKILSISFASLSYCIPQKNEYTYILEGFDRQWSKVEHGTKATYTNLSPGVYTFRVKGTNNDGIWSKDEATLEIVVNPPFYWSLPAKILYFFIVVVAAVFLFRYVIEREHRKHEEQMAKLNEEKELEVRNSKIRFFTMIAHEIRTPVSLIIGPLEKLVKTSAPLSAMERNSLSIIDRNAHRLLDLVNQLLDFSKMENQNMVVRFKVQNICDMLRTVCERFEPTFAQNGITFEVEYPDPHFTAVIDKESIIKVVSNLLTNARKYTRNYVRLMCMVLPDDNSFVIEVEDNGAGIVEKDHDRIFNAFYQSANNKPGTGIGLSIVKNIVEQHRGEIKVSSQLGHGAVFTVTLPVMQELSQNVTVENVAAEEQGPDMENNFGEIIVPPQISNEDNTAGRFGWGDGAILIVDDNDDMLAYLQENISLHSNVIVAHDGLEALDKLSNVDVSLIICDWMMPRMDGAELCRFVRRDPNMSHIPFIMLTAKTDTEAKVEGMNIGADAYIEKPFSMDYLEACCNNILNMRKMLREKYSSSPSEPITEIAHTSIDKEFLEKMQRIIEKNFSNPDLNVNFLADQMCISRSRLFAKIKTLADVSPNEMIQIVRLKKAAQLLSESNMKVSEVCYTVGFNNPSYFSKLFYKQFGMHPTEIRQQMSQQL